MEQKDLTRALRAAAESAIPDDMDLWPVLKSRVGAPRTEVIERAAATTGQRRPAGLVLTRRRATLALAGALVALVPGLGLATPLGENTFGKFVQRFGLMLVPSTTLPGPPIGMVRSIKVVGTPAAGQIRTQEFINGAPVTPGATPPAGSKLQPAKFFSQRPLQPIPLDQAQKQVHFTVRAPTWVPAGLTLQGALVAPGLIGGGGAVAIAKINPPSDAGSSGQQDRGVAVAVRYEGTGNAGAGTPVAAVTDASAGTSGAGVVTAGQLVSLDVPTSITIIYNRGGASDGRLQVTESEAGEAMGMIVPESAAQSLTVNGQPASYAKGKWQPVSGDPPSGLQWDATAGDGILSWDDGGVSYVVWSSGLGLGRDDLVRIAESLK